MSLFKKAVLGSGKLALGQISKVFTGLVFIKIGSTYLGPSGIGAFGILQNFQNLLIGVFGFGLPTIGIQLLSKNEDFKNIFSKIKSINWNISSGVFLAVMILLLFFGHLIIPDISFIEIILLALSIYFGLITLPLISFFQFKNRINDILISNIISAIIPSFIGIIIILFYGKLGLWIFLLMINLSTFIFLRIKFSQTVLQIPNSTLTKRFVFDFISNGTIIGFSGLLPLLISFLFRNHILNWYSLEKVGIVVAGVTILNGYTNIIFQGMAGDFFPRVSDTVNTEKIKKITSSQINLLFIILVPIVYAIILFPNEIVNIVFSNDFDNVTKILKFGAPVLLIRAVAWPKAYVLLSTGRNKLYFAAELSSAIIMLTCYILGYHFLKEIGLGIAIAVHGLFYALLIEYLLIKSKRKIPLENPLILILIFASVIIISYSNFTFGLLTSVFILLLVIILSLTQFNKKWREN